MLKVFLFFGKFWGCGDPKKNWKKKCKSCHILREKRVTLSPYLDNEFLLVAKTRQDSLTKSTLLFDSFFLCMTASPPTCQNWSKRGMSHCGLTIYIKKYLNAKEELWKLKHFTMQKYNLQKISLKKNQNLSIYYNSIIT